MLVQGKRPSLGSQSRGGEQGHVYGSGNKMGDKAKVRVLAQGWGIRSNFESGYRLRLGFLDTDRCKDKVRVMVQGQCIRTRLGSWYKAGDKAQGMLPIQEQETRPGLEYRQRTIFTVNN